MKKIRQLFAHKRKQTEIEQFYNENHDYYYRLAYYILGNYSDAEDAVSAAFLKINQKKSEIFQKTCPEIEAYCVIIVKNSSYDILRKKKSEILAVDKMQNEGNTIFAESAETAFIKNVEQEQLNKLVQALNSVDRKILELRAIEKLKFKQISLVVNLSEEAVKKRYQRLLKKLRTQLNDKGSESQ